MVLFRVAFSSAGDGKIFFRSIAVKPTPTSSPDGPFSSVCLLDLYLWQSYLWQSYLWQSYLWQSYGSGKDLPD